MHTIHARSLAPFKSMLVAAVIGLGGLPVPAAADTAPQLYGFCWAKAPPATAHAAGPTHHTTLVFPYDRWHLDEGRFFQAQFESMARSMLGLSAPKDQLVCEKEDTQDKAVALLHARIRQSFAAAGPATANFLSWVPHARPANAVAVPAVAAAPLAAAPAAPAAAPAAPAQAAASNRIAGLGPLSEEEQVNLAYFRESSCQQLAELEQSRAQRAREMDAGMAESAASMRKASKRAMWEQNRQELAEIVRRSSVLLEAVRAEKSCS